MKNHTFLKPALFILVSVSSLSLSNTESREPRNLALCKEEVREYVTSENYMEDLRSVVERARNYIAKNMGSKNRNAIVLDVDETSLSHLKYEMEYDFGYSRATWNEWLRKSEAEPILPTLELFRWAKSNAMAVFFVSGNTENLRAPIQKNLLRAGYADWDSLYLRPEGKREPTAVYKSRIRKEITERGYRIIANIGDQMSDLEGGYAEKTFKLPNPMYLTN